MPGVNVNFLGVCTIFRNLPSLVPPGVTVPPNRVVLVRNTLFTQQLSDIDPHIPKIQFPGTAFVFNGPPLPPVSPPLENTFSLNGVTLSIINAVTNVPFQPALDCLPGLQARLNPPAELGPPARLVYIPDPERAAAWFDVSSGSSWNAYIMNTDPVCATVPSISILHIETVGAPQLLVTPWDGSPGTIVTLSRTDDVPAVNVMNFAMGEGVVDDNRDFLLNYLTAETLPTSSVMIPEVNACTTQSPAVFRLPRCGDAGPGCSNTNFP